MGCSVIIICRADMKECRVKITVPPMANRAKREEEEYDMHARSFRQYSIQTNTFLPVLQACQNPSVLASNACIVYDNAIQRLLTSTSSTQQNRLKILPKFPIAPTFSPNFPACSFPHFTPVPNNHNAYKSAPFPHSRISSV